MRRLSTVNDTNWTVLNQTIPYIYARHPGPLVTYEPVNTQTFPKRTHEGKVGLVDLGESVVASVEVRCLLGERRYAVQLQVIAVDRGTEARAQ